MIRIASYQVKPAENIDDRKIQLQNILLQANSRQIDFLCLPEGFLTGYYSEESRARENSLEIGSHSFVNWLKEFENCSSTVIVGFNEQCMDDIFDSAAVIEKGELLGIQRKHHLYHRYFSSGSSFQIFQSKGITFGITICLDTNYFEPARLLALQGAVLLFSPMCNIVSVEHPYAKRPLYYSHLVARSFENRCWLATADWVWPNDENVICPGNTVIYDPNGKEIARSQEMREELLTVDIPLDQLNFDKGVRFKGSSLLTHELVKILESKNENFVATPSI